MLILYLKERKEKKMSPDQKKGIIADYEPFMVRSNQAAEDTLI